MTADASPARRPTPTQVSIAVTPSSATRSWNRAAAICIVRRPTTLWNVADTSTGPVLSAVTSPVADTVATVGSDDVQVA